MPCEEKSGEKIEEVISRPYVSDEGLFFVAPATPAGTPSRRQPGETVKALPGRPGRAGCGLPGAPKLPNRGAFVLSKRAAQDARALRKDDLRPRRREGASFSQIRCRNGRLVRLGCARVAPPRTAARTAAPAIKSLIPSSLLPTIARYCPAFLPQSYCCPRLPVIARHFPAFLPLSHGFPAHDGPLLPAICPRWPTIARYCPASFFPEQVSVYRPPFSVGPTSHAVSWETPELCAESRVCGRPPKEPMLRKGNVLYCVDKGYGHDVAVTSVATANGFSPPAWYGRILRRS